MFWIIRRLFWLGVIIVIIYLGANYQIDGKPVKQYAKEFYRSPLVQAVIRTGKEMIGEFWEKTMSSDEAPDKGAAEPSAEPSDELTNQDRNALDQVLEEEK